MKAQSPYFLLYPLPLTNIKPSLLARAIIAHLYYLPFEPRPGGAT